jgi:hypothetical protein
VTISLKKVNQIRFDFFKFDEIARRLFVRNVFAESRTDLSASQCGRG